ncbi:MAG: ThiF family adenylyltransferase [Eubacteriales bacterium]
MDLSRLEILFGHENVQKLKNATVAVVGLGGVGGICTESLARCGIGRMYICDGDKVEPSNINRQIVATQKSMGKNKALALKERLLDINPDAEIFAMDRNWTEEDNFLKDDRFDFVVDAIDSVPQKIDLIAYCKENGINIVSAMGAGLRHHGSMFEVDDIFNTFNDPLAKKIRKMLKDRGVESLNVVYSKEKPMKAETTIGSVMYAVAASGLRLSEHVVESIIEK